MTTGEGHILLVEDEERLRALLRTVLEPQGYTVHCCSDVPEARDWLENNRLPLALILTDMVMPNGTGLELEASARVSHPRAHILFMSGYAEQMIDDIAQLPAGAHFIQKPFTPRALAEKIRGVLAAGDQEGRPRG